jgi:hypothetical protein
MHLLVIAIKLGVEEKVFTIAIFLFHIQLMYYYKTSPPPLKSIITHIQRDKMVILKKVCVLFPLMKKSKLKRKKMQDETDKERKRK